MVNSRIHDIQHTRMILANINRVYPINFQFTLTDRRLAKMRLRKNGAMSMLNENVIVDSRY